jgi:nitrile hydratase beta subunit
VAAVDGIHDLGGMDGFGPVRIELDEPVFHDDWERRALGVAMSAFAMGLSNGGEFRHSIERMDPGHYLASPYYEHWITGIASRLVETGRVDRGELEQMAGGPFPLSGPVLAERIVDPADDVIQPRFEIGSRVRVREWHPRGHTRCPRYVRGKTGTVIRLDGSWSVPDVEAHSDQRRQEPTYSVRFEAADLWEDGQVAAAVYVDLWDSYLEAV